MKCKHGIECGFYPPHEKCPDCASSRGEEQLARENLVKTAFTSWIRTGFWGDIDSGVGKLYYEVYRKNAK